MHACGVIYNNVFKALLFINLAKTSFCFIGHHSRRLVGVRSNKCSFTHLCESSTTTRPRIYKGDKVIDDSCYKDELPPLPCPESDPADDVFRFVRNRFPLPLQHFLRDTGATRWLADTLVLLGIPTLLSSYPQAVDDFLALSDAPMWIQNLVATQEERDNSKIVRSVSCSFTEMQYGDHPMQLLHLMKPKHTRNRASEGGLVVFVHGGAWGSGRPWMYRLVARPFLQENMAVAVVGYRTWPDACARGQAQDIQLALHKLKTSSPDLAKNGVTLVGHSSGSHIGFSMCLLDHSVCMQNNIHSFVALSGVYDIPAHYEYEIGRGVNELSALKPACGQSVEGWVQNSPTQMVAEAMQDNDAHFPRFLLLHGGLDTTVPYKSTLDFSSALDSSKRSFDMSTKILPNLGHSETVVQLMMGGETRDVVMDWLLERRE